MRIAHYKVCILIQFYIFTLHNAMNSSIFPDILQNPNIETDRLRYAHLYYNACKNWFQGKLLRCYYMLMNRLKFK